MRYRPVPGRYGADGFWRFTLTPHRHKLTGMSDSFEAQLMPGGGLAVYSQIARASGQADPLLGRVLGDYRITEFIAAGGMSRVYRASRSDGHFDRDVAVKIAMAAGTDTQYRQRFLLEQRLLATLNHPNIAQLYDVGVTDEGWPYIVMELVDGSPIDDYVQSTDAGVAEVVGLLVQVADALVFAHNRLIVHRDIKPSNVIVDSEGVPKLLDFGIAKQIDSTDATLTQGFSPLTPRYASPEQIANKPITVASDVYQLGVLAVTLLSDENWGPTSLEDAATHVLRGTSEPLPEDLLAALPKDLIAVLESARQIDPDRRYVTCAEFAADLRRWQEGYPVTARRSNAVYRALRYIQRNRWPVAIAGSAALIITVSSIAYTLSLSESRRQAEQAASQAQAINDFLVDMMKKSSPVEGGRADLTARELLADSLSEVDQLAGFPRIQAALQQALGEVYLALGDIDQAEKLLEQSLQSREMTSAPVTEQAETIMTLGIVAYDHAQYQQALDHYERARLLLLEVYPEDDEELIRPLHLSGNALIRLGRLEEATAVIRQVLELRQQHLGPYSPDIAMSLDVLALVTTWQGDLETAEDLFLEAHEQFEKSGSMNTLAYSGSLDNYGRMLIDQGELAQALAYHKKALAILRSLYGGDHLNVAISMSRIAYVQLSMEDYEPALNGSLEAVEMFHRLADPPEYRIQFPLASLAHIYHAIGQPAKAVAAGEEALHYLRMGLGEDHWQVGVLMINQASHLLPLHGKQQAERQLLAGLELIRESEMAGTVAEAIGLQLLGELYLETGDAIAARQQFEDALTMAERVAPENTMTDQLREAIQELKLVDPAQPQLSEDL